jgi:hypothetical protein
MYYENLTDQALIIVSHEKLKYKFAAVGKSSSYKLIEAVKWPPQSTSRCRLNDKLTYSETSLAVACHAVGRGRSALYRQS